MGGTELMWWTVQLHARNTWRTFWIEANSRHDVIDDGIDQDEHFERMLGEALLEKSAPILIRPSAYKEWIADPPLWLPCSSNICSIRLT